VRDLQLARCEVIQEEQRLGALHHEVVDAHGHEIDADRLVPSALDGDLELGAHAVIGRHQDGVLEACPLQIKQPSEPAEVRVGARPPCFAHQWLDCVHQSVPRIDIHT
jgi:hypothetical protein